jgi:hypothetical protein
MLKHFTEKKLRRPFSFIALPVILLVPAIKHFVFKNLDVNNYLPRHKFQKTRNFRQRAAGGSE